MSGQIINASIVAAPKQRNSDGEKRDIKESRIPAQWNNPAKLRQKDRDACWTVKYTKAKPSQEGRPRVDLAVPAFWYKNHIGIDRRQPDRDQTRERDQRTTPGDRIDHPGGQPGDDQQHDVGEIHDAEESTGPGPVRPRRPRPGQ